MMMASERIVKDIGEIYERLFKHNAAIQGEINYFVKQFEEQQGDKDVKRLRKTLDNTVEITGSLIPEACSLLDNNLPALIAQTKTALAMCELILERERDPNKEIGLKGERARRSAEWKCFMDDMCDQSSAVDNKIDRQISQVKQYYEELEQKLHLTDSPK